jgi:glycosyltransferase involved in cell wall biosynthesis
MNVDISIIAPLLNEEENVYELYQRIKKSCSTLGVTYEIILIDDGSKDNTLQVIEKIAKEDSSLKYISFSRSFGHQAALFAGIEKSTGKKFEAVFFHFHGVKFYENDIVSLAPSLYQLDKSKIKLFYNPYVRELFKSNIEVNKLGFSFNSNGSSGISPYKSLNFGTLIKYYIEGFKSSRRNILGVFLLKKVKHHYFFNVTKL